MWGIPESELRLVEGLEAGADVIELGCGTAAICAWLTRRGFSPTGVDFVRPVLETAAEFEREFEVGFPLLCANAEHLHFEDGSFDCAISEYGASIWCDPHRWVTEAARLLRPNGLLVFVTNSALLVSCTPEDGGLAGVRLVRDYFSRYRVEFEGIDAVEFHLNHGNWVRLLRANGFVIEDLVETRPPEGATPRTPFASAEWAQLWPSEEIWVARKAPQPSSSDAPEPEPLTAGPDLHRPPQDPEPPEHPEHHRMLREHGEASEEGKAAGVLPDADPARVNLAAPLLDGGQIRVPAKAAATDGSQPGSSPSRATGTVSLSSATLEELDELPGVGRITAQRIVDYRTEHGPFALVDDLHAVPGFGPTRIEQLRDLVTP
jgi:comEA protein